jgi:hypothetical protein
MGSLRKTRCKGRSSERTWLTGIGITRTSKRIPVRRASEKAELDQMICDIRERWSEALAASPDDFD